MSYKAKKSKLEWLWDGHKKPTNRREFMGKGLLGSSAFIFTPSILQLLSSSSAFAADAGCEPVASGLPGYITINLSGGGGQASQYFGLNAARQPLASYTKSGLGMFSAATFTNEFQGVPFPAASPFIAGIRATAGAAVRSNTAFVATLVPSRDDRNDNILDASSLVAAAGLSGTLLPPLGTLAGAKSGIGQASALLSPPAPLIVRSLADLGSAIGIGSNSVLAQKLSVSQRTSMLTTINKLSQSQGRAIASVNSSSGTMLSKLVACATGKNVDLSVPSNDPGIDPTLSTNANATGMNAIWNFTTATAMAGRSQNERKVFGSLVYNTILGKAAASGLELGGYDFHDGTRTTGDRMMNEVGQLVGNILATAALLQKKVVIHLVADGSTGTDEGGASAVYVSDRGDGGMTFMFAYDPARTAMSMMKSDATKWQLGDYTTGQGSDANNAAVGSPEKAGIATFANYLQFAGKYGTLFQNVAPRYSPDMENYVLRFG